MLRNVPRIFLPVLLASLAVLACGDDEETDASPTPSATVDPVTATSEPSTTPESAETVAPNGFVVRHIGPDETVAGIESGAIFLDTETGDIEFVTMAEPQANAVAFSISPDNRFVFVDEGPGFLLDRDTDVVWEGDELPGRPMTGMGGLLSFGGLLVVETDAAGRDYSIVDAGLQERSRFTLAEGNGNPVASWPSTFGPHALLFNGKYMVLDLTGGTISPVAYDVAQHWSVTAHPLIDGFALTSFDKGTRPRCRITLFSWDGQLQSKADLEPCSNSNCSRRFDVSPDGTRVAAWAALGAQEDAGPGYNPILGAVYVYEASTGDPLSG